HGKSTAESRAQKLASEAGQASMFDVDNWTELNEYEANQRALSGAAARVETVLDTHPWLRVTERIAEQQGFFHWDLDFSTVFERGGFDLRIGNPPWLRTDVNEAEILSDFQSSYAQEKRIPADQWADNKNRVLVNRESLVAYLSIQSANEGSREFLGS